MCSGLLALCGQTPRPSPPHTHPQDIARFPLSPTDTEISPYARDANTPRVCSRALKSAALSLQTRVVPEPCII